MSNNNANPLLQDEDIRNAYYNFGKDIINYFSKIRDYNTLAIDNLKDLSDSLLQDMREISI